MKFSTNINPDENVSLGVLACLPSLVVVILLTIAIDSAGFIASISVIVFCLAALYLYEKGSGGLPIKGRWWFTGIILLGLVLSFLSVIALHLSRAYDSVAITHTVNMSKAQFITNNVLSTRILRLELGNLAMFTIFGLLGSIRTFRYIFSTHKVSMQTQAHEPQSPIS